MHLQEKLLELEEKDQESLMMQKYLDNLCVEEMERMKERKKEQERMREELIKSNMDLIKRKV